jgi:hypothetical protein
MKGYEYTEAECREWNCPHWVRYLALATVRGLAKLTSSISASRLQALCQRALFLQCFEEGTEATALPCWDLLLLERKELVTVCQVWYQVKAEGTTEPALRSFTILQD